jgi:uncharacterized membrane protein YdjX (TVP38/TMEM64 family)
MKKEEIYQFRYIIYIFIFVAYLSIAGNITENTIILGATLLQGIISVFPTLIVILYGLEKTTLINTFLLVSIGQLIAATIAYELGERKINNLEKRVLSKEKKKTLDKIFRQNDFLGTLTTRYSLIPSGVISIFAGASKINKKHFFLANLFSFIPLTLLVCLAGKGLQEIISLDIIILVILLIVILLLIMEIRKK